VALGDVWVVYDLMHLPCLRVLCLSSFPWLYSMCCTAHMCAASKHMLGLCCRCDDVVCSTTEDLVARVKAITGGKGAAAVIDSVGGSLSQALGAAVRDGGSVWLYGLMEGLTITGSGVDCLFRWVVARGHVAGPLWENDAAAPWSGLCERCSMQHYSMQHYSTMGVLCESPL
jgi:hypothetical protein